MKNRDGRVPERLREWGKRRVLRRVLEVGQRIGLDVLPRHFYSQVPDLRELRRRRDWRRPYRMSSVKGSDLDAQLAFVRESCQPALVDRLGAGRVYERACERNGSRGFGPVEADFLYCFVVTHRPRRIIQVGCGVSTAVLLRASEDAGLGLDMRCIDPHPSPFLRSAGKSGEIELIDERAESLPIAALSEGLGEGGLLFVDSTHSVRPGSEVNRIVLEVLPGLEDGAWVHFHDIFFPYDYSPRILLDDLFFWSETALLQAFLASNERYTLRVALSMLHRERAEALRQILPSYHPAQHVDGLALEGRPDAGDFPSSAYLQVAAHR